MSDVFTGALMSEESKNVFMGSQEMSPSKKAKTGEPMSPELDLSHFQIPETLGESLEDFFKDNDPFFETHYVQNIKLIGSCFATSGHVDLFSPLPKNSDGIKMSNDRLWYLCCLLKDLAMKQKTIIEELKK